MTLEIDNTVTPTSDQSDMGPAPVQGKAKKGLSATSAVSYFSEPPEIQGITEKKTWVESTDFSISTNIAPRPHQKIPENPVAQATNPYLIIGFDTEFKTPDYHVNREQVYAGQAKYRVLSYQFHAKTSDGREWQGICCPEDFKRMSLGEFLVFALGVGARDHHIKNLPTKIYLVGHFTRADLPAFSDFKNFTEYLSSVRNTFISVDTGTPLNINYSDASITELKICFRDTLLLTPQASKSLKAIGELVGVPKLQLDPDPVKHKKMIQNMDRVRSEHWDIFKRYALNDATICVRYIDNIIAQYERVTGEKHVPLTLTSIGVKLLQKSWQKHFKKDPLEIVGKELHIESTFDKKNGRYIKTKRPVSMERLHWYNDFVTECYHGGRNEQFWFGPGFKDEWSDFDLSSAYPTAMALIGMPKWKDIRDESDINQFTPETLGFANVEFEFPPETRFPTFPVRTSHGLIFPLKGRSYCSSPELHVAQQLGATIKIIKGIIVPSDPSIRVFGEFIKYCLEERKTAGSKTLEGLFWKEISNSTYGKTAQGLRPKRIYDMREQSTRELPPSAITNPYFAAYITSFTRAVMGEIINRLPASTCVFSCTTDGFLSNATEVEIARAQDGTMANIFKTSREALTGAPSILEKKHAIRKPLGWRTRGQATLLPGTLNGEREDQNIVLAKGGIFTPPECETIAEQNEEITKLFFDRTPTSMLLVESMTGVRDIVEHGADLVTKDISKRLSMEFDWKCKPMGIGFSNTYNHLIFSTRPWTTAEQFALVRESWDEYTKEAKICLKTKQDYDAFSSYLESTSLLTKEKGRYLKKVNPDINRLRQILCGAWKNSEAGFIYKDNGMTARGFAASLTEHGIPCERSHVENASRRGFVPHSCPPTTKVTTLLAKLKREFVNLDIALILNNDIPDDAVRLDATDECEFVSRCD